MVAFERGRSVQPDRREAPREEVYHRTRATLQTGQTIVVHLVNISAAGFMVRTENELQPGTPLLLRLPVVGDRPAEVRWSLAGRIGCQFMRPIELGDYLQLLGTLVKEG